MKWHNEIVHDTDKHNDTQDQVSSTIGKRAALQAIAVMNHVVETKFAMMPPEEKLQVASEPPLSTSAMPVNAETSSQTPASCFAYETLTGRYGKYVKKVLLHKGTKFPAAISSPCHSTTQHTQLLSDFGSRRLP